MTIASSYPVKDLGTYDSVGSLYAFLWIGELETLMWVVNHKSRQYKQTKLYGFVLF